MGEGLRRYAFIELDGAIIFIALIYLSFQILQGIIGGISAYFSR